MTIKVAGTTAIRTLGAGLTDAQVGAGLARFARSKGIPITGVAMDDLLAIADHFIDEGRRGAKAQQVADDNAAAQAAIVAKAELDNSL